VKEQGEGGREKKGRGAEALRLRDGRAEERTNGNVSLDPIDGETTVKQTDIGRLSFVLGAFAVPEAETI
jgi:hypothetical protein